MKISRYDGSRLSMVLAGMVTDQVVCSRISSLMKGVPIFDSPWANRIAEWCSSHLNKYGEAPKEKIQQIFEEWASTADADKDTISQIERFLCHLSDYYQDSSPKSSEYILDNAGEILNTSKIKRTIEEVQEELSLPGGLEKAYHKLNSITKLNVGRGSYVDVTDFEVGRRSFDRERDKCLIEYPNSLGEFFGDSLQRGTLFSFMGVDKSGKSFWLLDLAYRLIKKKRRVAYFEAGDLGEQETVRRLYQRAARAPETAGKYDYPISFNQDMTLSKIFREFESLTPQEGYSQLMKTVGDKDLFRLCCHPNSCLTVQQIFSTTKEWEREDWVPDAIIIDYADILAAPTGFRDTLDQIDENWKQLRRLSQELHCLVVTATQTSAAAYGSDSILTRKHFSGRKTKLAHVNGMIGLNVSPEDRKNGVTRLNWIVRRSGQWSEYQQVYTAGNLALARPVIISSWKKNP